MRKFLASLVAALVLAALAGVAPAADEEKKFGPNVGDFVKEFKLKEVTDGKEYSVSDYTKTGKDTAFLFMQSACGLCIAEIREFMASKDDIEGKLNVVLISVDFEITRVKPYKEANKIPFPVLHDSEAKTLASVNMTSTPSTVVVGPDGKIKAKVAGYDRLGVKNFIKSYAQ